MTLNSRTQLMLGKPSALSDGGNSSLSTHGNIHQDSPRRRWRENTLKDWKMKQSLFSKHCVIKSYINNSKILGNLQIRGNQATHFQVIHWPEKVIKKQFKSDANGAVIYRRLHNGANSIFSGKFTDGKSCNTERRKASNTAEGIKKKRQIKRKLEG